MCDRYKYCRTPHLPWSPGYDPNSEVLGDPGFFVGKEVVISEKIDGENCSFYSDGYIHARSINSRHHPSRSWVKGLAAQVAPNLPTGWRCVGENLFAFHSILYTELPSYFFCFGIYNESNICISWDETTEFCQLLGLEMVPVLYRGLWDEQLIRERWTGKGSYPTFATKQASPTSLDDFYPTSAEGYVVRLATAFHYNDFAKSVAKWVRPHHVVDRGIHWITATVFPNRLKV